MQTREEDEKEDTEKVDKLNQTDSNDHYMYLMPDNFIQEAVVNPKEWTNEEHLLAKEILKKRNIKHGRNNKTL